jgi:hypothetical protein
MKFPSVFRTATPMRFDIKPRYYDPVREEIEQRTSQIKKDLEAEGILQKTDGNLDVGSYGSGLRGSFANYRGIKEREGVSMFTSTAMIRTLIFLFLLGTIFGYIYIGPVIFEYMAYVAALGGAIYYFYKLKSKKKNG